MLGRMIGELVRREGATVLARLLRTTYDLDVAEMALRDAALSALSAWSAAGVPAEPVTWLRDVAQQRMALLGNVFAPRRVHEPNDPITDDPRIAGGDERLFLAFLCAHPALASEDQMMLALRTLCGLSTREIANAFQADDETVKRWRSRAVKVLVAMPARTPTPETFRSRLDALLDLVRRIFELAQHASDDAFTRTHDAAAESIRIARLLALTLPDEPDTQALLAWLLMRDAQRDTRLSGNGAVIPVAEQDHARWDRDNMSEGLAVLSRVACTSPPSLYQLQAAIVAVHVRASGPEDTDWTRLLDLLTALQQLAPSLDTELEIARATGMTAGPDRGLRLIDRLIARSESELSPVLLSARAGLCRRGNRLVEARGAYLSALTLARTAGEREYFERCLAELAP